MVKGGERIMIVESLEGGNKKRKKDCSKGKREEQKKGKKDGEWFEREKKGRRKKERMNERKNERERKKDCQIVRNEEKKGCPRKDIP